MELMADYTLQKKRMVNFKIPIEIETIKYKTVKVNFKIIKRAL